MPQLIGLVLAGGVDPPTARRKGERVVGGITLAERAATALRPLTGSVLVSIDPGAINPAPKYPAVEDGAHAGAGPLAGIHAAMGVTGQADLLVLACEYPAVGTEFLRRIVAAAGPEHDLVFPYDACGRDHPLVGVWRRSTEPCVAAALDLRVHKVRAILADLVVLRLGPKDLPGFDLAALLGITGTDGPESP